MTSLVGRYNVTIKPTYGKQQTLRNVTVQHNAIWDDLVHASGVRRAFKASWVVAIEKLS